MKIIQYTNDKANVILGKDYCPNSAMRNEFQSELISCQMQRIELYGNQLKQYVVDEYAQFILFHLKIRNISKSKILIDTTSFYIKFDGNGPYLCEEYFAYPNQFTDRFELNPYEVKSGCLVFLIAKTSKKIMLCYDEELDDNPKMYKLKYILS